MARRKPESPSPTAESGGVPYAELVHTGMLLGAEPSVPALLQRLTEAAVRLADARYGALAILDEAGELAQFLTVGLTEAERAAIGPPPAGRGLIGALLADPRPVRLDRLQSDPRSVGFPPHHPAMTSLLGVPVRAAGRLFGALYLTEKRGGSPFSVDDEAAVLALASQAGVAIANAEAHAELDESRQLLIALGEVRREVIDAVAIDRILHAIAEHTRRLSGADLTLIALEDRTAAPSRLRVEAAAGAGTSDLVGRVIGGGWTVSHDVARSGEAEHVSGRDDPRVAPLAALTGPLADLIVVPLATRRDFRTVEVCRREPGAPFGPRAVALVQHFASQAALALAHASVQEELRRLAVAEDRRRIARDLHDEPVQVLVYLARQLEGLAGDLPANDRGANRLAAARRTLVAVVDSLRQLAEGLRSPILEERGLELAVGELVERFRQRLGIPVDLRRDGMAARLSPELELGALRIVQEALTNVERHAGAHHVVVSLRLRDRTLRLAVADDGRGISARPRRRDGTGLGISGMRERAAALGGRVRLRSRPGRGTVVTARLPLAAVPGGSI